MDSCESLCASDHILNLVFASLSLLAPDTTAAGASPDPANAAAMTASTTSTTTTTADSRAIPAAKALVSTRDFASVGDPTAAGQYVTLFGNTKPAEKSDINDRIPIELGLKFRTSAPGRIVGIRFYRSVKDPKGHTVSLWTSKGWRLASASVKASQLPGDGWIEIKFAAPVKIAPGETYVASYHTSIGQYPSEEGGLATEKTNGPLTALGGGTNEGNGVFRYGSGGVMPIYSSQNTHFFVDVLFNADASTRLAGHDDN